MFDSPAYANFTTRYLTKIFNPRTPDDLQVRCFIVAGQTNSLNIWHHSGFPKSSWVVPMAGRAMTVYGHKFQFWQRGFDAALAVRNTG
jgi:hypothetical protein